MPYRGVSNRARMSGRQSFARRVPVVAVVRSNNNGIHFDSKRLKGPFNPPNTSNDIVVDKVVRLTSNVPQSGRLSVTFPMLVAALNVPTGGNFIRVSKISVWSQQFSTSSVIGSDTETLTVIIPGDGIAGAVPGGDGASFSDNGTFGARRPCVHVSLPSLMAQRWVIPSGAGEPDLFAQVQIDADEASGTAVVIHVTCQIRLVARQF